MAAGEARRVGGAVIANQRGAPRWSPLWDWCPDVHREHERTVRNAGMCRPYIDYPRSNSHRWAFRDYTPMPARIELPPDRLQSGHAARGLVLLEPSIKTGASPNKDWGWDRWQELVALRPGMPWLQIGPATGRRLAGVRFMETADFGAALSVLKFARAAILPEGGLHHAAAAMGCPAVVLFGGYIGPHVTGYAGQRAIYTGTPETLGWRIPHDGCRAAMNSITPDMVLAELEALL